MSDFPVFSFAQMMEQFESLPKPTKRGAQLRARRETFNHWCGQLSLQSAPVEDAGLALLGSIPLIPDDTLPPGFIAVVTTDDEGEKDLVFWKVDMDG